MDRKQLLDTLKIVEPALSTQGAVPVFTHLCFTGSTVTAYNDVVAITVPCDMPFQGGLPGKTLIKWLAAAPAAEVKLKMDADQLRLSSSRARVTLPILPTDQFVFESPSTGDAIGLVAGETGYGEFVDALEFTTLAMGTDAMHLWRMGVTFVFQEDGLMLYASDNFTLAAAFCPAVTSEGNPMAMPPRFVELLVSLAKNRKLESLLMREGEWVQAMFEDGVILWSKALIEVNADNYETAVRGVYEVAGTLSGIPDTLGEMVNRMRVVLGTTLSKQPYADFEVQGGGLSIRSSVPGVKAAESVPGQDQPDAKATLVLEQVKRVLPYVSEYNLLDGQGILFENADKGFVYFVSGVAE